MLVLALYWSLYLYSDWQDFPVTTTVTTTGFVKVKIERLGLVRVNNTLLG
jgi:hypothetical protein